MFKVVILGHEPRLGGGFRDLYPLYRWRRDLSNAGVSVRVKYRESDILKDHADVLIITSRGYNIHDTNSVSERVSGYRRNYDKIAWFDTVDTSGSDSFAIMPYVDMFLKKQVLKDKEAYTVNKKDLSVRSWLPKPPKISRYPDYVPCAPCYLPKIKVGWNIGMCDYRVLSSGVRFLRNYFFSNPYFQDVNTRRDLDLVNRGTVNYDDSGIDFQRANLAMQLRKLNRKYRVAQGPKLNYAAYMSELRDTKLSISPFGWGEICYRDFESVLAGTILAKPSMEHIETWPNIYIPNSSYVPLDWDMGNVASEVARALVHYDTYKKIAITAQQLLQEYVLNSVPFVERFTNLLK
jgi:hypothetical protein